MTPKKNPILAAQFDRRIADQILRVAEARGEDVSSFLRRGAMRELAHLGYLDAATTKALGD